MSRQGYMPSFCLLTTYFFTCAGDACSRLDPPCLRLASFSPLSRCPSFHFCGRGRSCGGLRPEQNQMPHGFPKTLLPPLQICVLCSRLMVKVGCCCGHSPCLRIVSASWCSLVRHGNHGHHGHHMNMVPIVLVAHHGVP